MKRIFALILALCMVASLAACKKKSDNQITSKAGDGVTVGHYVKPTESSKSFDKNSVAESIEVVDTNVIDNTTVGGKGSTAVAKVKNNSEFVVSITPSFVDDEGNAIDTSKAINKTILAVSPGDEVIVTADSQTQISDFSVSFAVEQTKDCADVKNYIQASVENADNIAKDGKVEVKAFNSVDRNVETMLVGYAFYKGDVPVYVNSGSFTAISIGQTITMNLGLPKDADILALDYDKVEPIIYYATSKN